MVASAALSAPAVGQEIDPVTITRVPDRETVTIDPAKAYLLMEAPGVMQAMFLLAPTEAQRADWASQRAAALAEAIGEYPRRVQRYQRDMETWQATGRRESRRPVAPVEPTEDSFAWPELESRLLVIIGPFNRFHSADGGSLWLYEVPAGTYTYYGQGAPGMGDCACMGSVRFAVPAGQITAFRHGLQWLDREGNPVDERPQVDNSNDMVARMAFYLDPPSDFALDPRLPRDRLRPAQFEPVERLPNWFGGTVNRIQPIPGLFHYERGRVVDERGGN